MTSPKLQFIGGGKMAEALLGGMIATGWAAADEIHVVEPSAERRTVLSDAHPSLSIGDAGRRGRCRAGGETPDRTRGVPRSGRCVRAASVVDCRGITTAAMEAALPEGTVVVRSMPNTPALVGRAWRRSPPASMQATMTSCGPPHSLRRRQGRHRG